MTWNLEMYRKDSGLCFGVCSINLEQDRYCSYNVKLKARSCMRCCYGNATPRSLYTVVGPQIAVNKEPVETQE
jgi:hypothetical protein